MSKLKKPKVTRSVAAAIKSLERAGKLTAHAVVDAARDAKSPLHGYFEWDDSKAAEQYRLDQARVLIRTVQVRITIGQDEYIKVPQYVRDPEMPPSEQGYVSLPEIKDDPLASRAALYAELTRIEGLLTRAEKIAEACGLKAEIVKVQTRVKALRRRIQPSAGA